MIRKVQRNKIKVLNFQNGFKCFCWFEWIVRCRTHMHTHKKCTYDRNANENALSLSPSLLSFVWSDAIWEIWVLEMLLLIPQNRRRCYDAYSKCWCLVKIRVCNLNKWRTGKKLKFSHATFEFIWSEIRKRTRNNGSENGRQLCLLNCERNT